MASSNSLFINLAILLSCEAVLIDLSTLLAAGTKTPKIFIIQDELMYPNNSNYDNYTRNLTDGIRNSLNLSCIFNGPTQWIWDPRKLQDFPTPIPTPVISKEWRQLNDSYEIFVSNLTIVNLPSNQPLDLNFSCFSREKTKIKEVDPLVTCVQIQDMFPDTRKLHILDRLSLKTCSKDMKPVDQFDTSNCSHTLIVDLLTLQAECQNQVIRTLSCENLDYCQTLFSTQTCSKDWQTSSTLTNNEKMLSIKNQWSPLIVYCELRFDFPDSYSWTSYVSLYPSFRHQNFQNVTYHKTVKDALDDYSIQLSTLPSDYGRDLHVNDLIFRDTFAEGESVSFVCVAMRYLFMHGFQWKINNITLPDEESEYSNPVILNTEGRGNKYLHLIRRVITMNTTKYGNISNVSCHASVWNSKTFKSATTAVSLYPAVSPKVKNVTCQDNNDNNTLYNFKCSCWFTGWPQPAIIWGGSVQLNMRNEATLSLALSNESTHPHNKTWIAHKLLIKPSIDSTDPPVITCEARNVLGKNIYSHNIDMDVPYTIYKWIITGLVTVCVSGVIFGGILYWRYYKKLTLYAERQHHLTVEEIDEFYSGASTTYTTCEALLLPYNSDYEIPRDQITLDGSVLGSGQFGFVLKGTIKTLPVAVKTIKPTADVIYFKSLLSELKILQFIGKHPNIVNLIGANTANIKKREVLLIIDYCSNGSLINFLKLCRPKFVDFLNQTNSESEPVRYHIYENSSKIILTTGNLLDFSIDCARALNYLASKNVVHADIAARNVLVTEDLRAKICDFGISKQLLHYTVYVQKMDDMEFSLASDKWSYGILIWEIFSLGELPYPGEQWSFKSYQMLLEGYRMQKPKYANDNLYKLMLECWNAQPQERPEYESIITQLKQEEDKLT